MSEGQVVTFYSYKGGTGRTMALANTAWILASAGKRVLVVDWDLDSPGLHKFFNPFLAPGVATTTAGVIDLISDYQWAAMRNEPRPGDWHKEYARAEKHAISLDWEFPDGGTLDYLSPGRANRDYSSPASGFNWDNFYDRQGGGQFFDALRADMKACYDYTLIDSRTGASDIAGICTVQMPDILVDCFTLANQGIDGASQTARDISERYRDRNIRIFPVPMRIDMGEKERCDVGRALARRKFDGFPKGMTAEEADEYWGAVEIPYTPFYAFEEILSTFGDDPARPGSLLAAFERLTSVITGGEVGSFPRMEEALRLRHLDKFVRRHPALQTDVHISYAHEDRMWADWIAAVLDRQGYRVALRGVEADESGAGESEGEAPRTVVVLSGAYLRTPRALVVWSRLTAAETAGRGELIPVRTSEARFPSPFGDRALADLTRIGEHSAAETLLKAFGRTDELSAVDVSAVGARFPGSVPRVWNVSTRNAAFTGRSTVLEALRRQLVGGSAAVVLPQALYGLGGVGKTQVALEYAHRFKADYDLVWWVSSEDRERINAAFEDLARELGIRVGENIAEVVGAVREALRVGSPHSRWLLIFDNAGDPDELRDFFPGGTGHVVITSRNQAWSSVAAPLEVDVFSQQESLEHLSRRVPGLAAGDALEVASALGHLPIAVEQAAAWLAETGMPAATFVEQLESETARVLSMGQPADYPHPVAVTWNLSLGQLRESSPASVRLLQLCAFFAPEPVSMSLLYSDEMISSLLPYDDSLQEKLVLGRVIQEIGRFALARVDQGNNTIQVHRLVQSVIRSQMTEEEQDKACHEVHRILVGARPRQGEVDDPENWTRYDLIWQHLQPSRATECTEEATRQLLTDRVRYLWKRGDFDSALVLGDRLANYWEETFGTDDRQRLHLLFNVANVKRSQGKYQEARELDEWARDMQRRVVGEWHPHTLMTAGGLGADLRGLGEYGEALELDKATFERWKTLYGEDHPRTLAAANNLALSYRLVGDSHNARELDEDTLLRRSRVLGPTHPYTLYSASQLARDLREIGIYQESVEILRTTLQHYKETLGENFVDTLRAAKSLAVSLRRAGEQQEAWQLAKETEDRYRQRYPGTPDALAATLELACCESALDDKAAARDRAARIVEVYRENLGEDHPGTLIARNNLAIYLRGTGEAGKAGGEAEEVLEGLRRQLGENHPFTLSAAINLANCLGDAGRAAEAEALERRTLDELRTALGPEHPDTLTCEANLAVTLHALERTAQAERLRERVLAVKARVLGEDHPTLAHLRQWRRINRDLEPQPF
ncbi:FxSxx-COOH system tetratricopeptide repeat protein [Planomonospora venezuelensis]|uniref:Tetratricopeptide (TPR) repeat protein n=1 Tax=Planomonospora venezuelensis TaxID=1999 RepID=A0A841D3N5_PLAVE|nr:FxSxx-COOH system tetratricopeptide repeat protein [Planomonospora venezuelensis]MBB5962775.1 tetratricopeptide (TPR) repeat protein [Planomonospora venezuelensis]GIM99430.1 hypothetical protein Pve01_10890 [Planomonospora venezuelensis]